MKLILEHAARKFGNDLVFKNLNLQLVQGDSLAVLGQNGSGKSTLLMVICGFYALNKGKVEWIQNEKIIPEEKRYQYFSLCSPFMEIPPDFTCLEFLTNHQKLKPTSNKLNPLQLLESVNLANASHKLIRQLSSGMKQRLKLIATLNAEVPVILLDEPCTNLDEQGIQWYRQTLTSILQTKQSIVIIASNMKAEYDICKAEININQFK